MERKDKYEHGQRCAPYVPNGEAKGDSSARYYRTMGDLLTRKGKKSKHPKREDEEERSQHVSAYIPAAEQSESLGRFMVSITNKKQP